MITLLTDFGLADPYVGIMKGVILGICPTARLVDVTHGIPPQSIRLGAFALEASWRYFPPGTVHLIVIDPGVGGTRAPLVLSANGHLFVAPDNGVLTPVLEAASNAYAYRLENSAFRLPTVSDTFHGRDIFSPAAAWLSRGIPPEQFGAHHPEPKRLRALCPEVNGSGMLGEVVYVDIFGNLITNLPVPEAGFPEQTVVMFGERRIPYVRNYQDVPPGALLALRSSFGRLEVAVNQGAACALLGASVGNHISVLWPQETRS